ncbi:MAG: hypothetical protein HOO06_08355 [Bdellovibrionaceae bacterium]|jgi:spore photoproduct lyase|nr:hypothetical protein [Pseudobdellovibrionaceae bacterium]
MKQDNYKSKWAELEKLSLFKKLPLTEQTDIKDICYDHLFTFQEFKQYVEVHKDFKMWNKPSLQTQWNHWSQQSSLKGRELKKHNFNKLNKTVNQYKVELTNYNSVLVKKNFPAKKIDFKTSPSEEKLLGFCPVASEKTVCCNLRTIDAVKNCGFGCSYCAIETMFSGGKVLFHDNLSEKLKNMELDPKKFYHIGTGQSSDSLIWGNKNGLLDDLMHFAEENKNIILEFKSKSNNIKFFLENDIPKNIFCSWSLNPQVIIDNEEHKSASLEQRLSAAKQVANKGIKVSFHFHPIVYYKGWEQDYKNIIEEIKKNFTPEQILIISFGTLTFPKPIIKKIREFDVQSQILQMPMVTNPEGKMTYPEEIKNKIFKTTYDYFSSWHDQVFFYLCMEERNYWYESLGYCYETNDEFEEAMLASIKSKVPLSLNN